MSQFLKNKQHGANLFYFFGRSLSRLYTKLMFKKMIFNADLLPKGPKIYAINHPSTLDPLYVMSAIKEPSHALLTHLVFRIALIGKIIQWAGHIKVDDQNRYSAFADAIQLLRKKRSIIIFPEGRVSSSNEKMSKLKTGAIRLALKTGVPIVPVGIYLDEKKMKIKQLQFETGQEEFKWYRSGKYIISFGKALHFKGKEENRELVLKQSLILKHQIENLIAQSKLAFAPACHSR